MARVHPTLLEERAELLQHLVLVLLEEMAETAMAQQRMMILQEAQAENLEEILKIFLEPEKIHRLNMPLCRYSPT